MGEDGRTRDILFSSGNGDPKGERLLHTICSHCQRAETARVDERVYHEPTDLGCLVTSMMLLSPP